MLNEQTFEFSQARLKLKDSLRFTMRQSAASLEYLLEDESTGRFFRVGLPQYTFLTMLDGNRTISTALMKTATLLRQNAIDENEAASLCKWAIESGLVDSEVGNSAQRREEQHEMQQKAQLVSYLNPMMLRMPLFNPDSIVTDIARYASFIISPMGLMVWLTVVVYGFLRLSMHWNEFFIDRIESFGASDLLWIAVAWMVLKVIHELAHSLVCKKFGGRVKNCGFLLLLMIPMPYVDVTSSWRFDNKWKRILTSAAGMMAEVFIAAIACLIWIEAAPGPIRYHCGNLIISATVHTLFFNINPLMKFDGYYMLSDFLELPNLATHGRQWLKGQFKWLYFGAKPAALKETGYRALAVKAYGILAMAWFGFIAVGMSLAASGLIEGFGLVIALIACILWVGIPLFKLISFTISGTDTERPNRVWFASAIAITLLLVGGFLGFCPSPSVITAPVVIEFEEWSIIRSNAAGFAKQIHVADGDTVNEGDLLVTLENKDIGLELASLKIDIEISKLRIDNLFNAGEISQVQHERESLTSMLERKSELDARISDLKIFAPRSGTVLARDLGTLKGQYMTPGEEIMSIGKPGDMHAVGLAEQTDVDWILENPDSDVELQVWGRYESAMIPGKITKIDPRARDDLPNEAFAAAAGGPLAVVPRSQVESGQEEADGDLMLTEPRVKLEIALEPEDRQDLLAGQSGILMVRNRNENMGSYIVSGFKRFVTANNLRTHGL